MSTSSTPQSTLKVAFLERAREKPDCDRTVDIEASDNKIVHPPPAFSSAEEISVT
jgi:hypothetical protein